MPRHARRKSRTGIYHVMLRGINQQTIFEDEEDKEKFLEALKRYKSISEYKILGFCLMGNHIHLLLKVEKEELEQIFKRIGGCYVYWYNWKYHRTGHLFQDRFKSEPVEDDRYMLTVLRYIHQNPVKAGICENIVDYKYSSYKDYICDNILGVTDTDFILSKVSKDQFISFNNEKNNDVCLDLEEKDFRISDSDASKIIQKVSRCKNSSEFQLLEIPRRDKHIKKLREKGLSIRQISRLTGISKGIVEKTR